MVDGQVQGRMKVLRGDQWVLEDEVVIWEKEFVRSPIAKIPPGGYKMTSTLNRPSST